MKIVGGEAGSKVYYDDAGKKYDLTQWADPNDILGFGYGKGSHVVYDPSEAMARGLVDAYGNDTGYRPTKKEWDEYDANASKKDPMYAGDFGPIFFGEYKPTLYKDETAVPFPYPEAEREIMEFRGSREHPGSPGGFTSWFGPKLLTPVVGGGITAAASYINPLLGAATGALTTKMMNKDADWKNMALSAALAYAGGKGSEYLSGAGSAANSANAGMTGADLATGAAEGASAASNIGTQAATNYLSPTAARAVTNAATAGLGTGLRTGDWRRAVLDAVLGGATSYTGQGVNSIAGGAPEWAQRLATNLINRGVRTGANYAYNKNVYGR